MKKWIPRIIVLAILLFSVLGYFFLPLVHNMLAPIFALFASLNVEAVAAYIRSFGVLAAAISFLLMILQSVAAPLPAFLLTFANAAIFGWWMGAILSWSSAMAGATVCFCIAHLLGRDAVVKLTSKTALKQLDLFFEKYGKNTILICRLLPFVSFDVVSYAAGLTAMKLLPFLIATGIGQLPATLVYSYVGGMLSGSVRLVVTALLIIFALSALAFLLKSIFSKPHSSKQKAIEHSSEKLKQEKEEGI
ncbi:MAG: TVP38/TMEM64 family protein [Termitinemataceae bacterium]|nr:MAG: TVP38/TMEM64 family protein [Termitinemataceae bacterium]